MIRHAPFLLLLGCAAEIDAPDLEYNVTVTGISSNCLETTEGYQEEFRYQVYFNSSDAELRVGGDTFARGYRSGCALSYQSSVWLEERNGGDLRWQLSGTAEYQGEAGGCDLPEGLDWSGTEIAEIIESEDESVEEGCTYEMSVEGVYVGGAS